MMRMLMRTLRELGSAGLHFLVTPTNQRAADFYRHLGFTEIPRRDGPLVFAMDLRPADLKGALAP
jgi:ribosomal protein S18 acetylase RimI-like enzyme